MAAGRCITAANSNMSCTVKAYYALKLAGDDPARAAHGSGRAPRSWSAAARRAPTCSPASRWRCSVKFRGAACPTFPSKSCCCRDGFPSTSTRSRTGRAPSWCRCSSCARASRWRRTRATCTSANCSRRRPEEERDYFRDSRQRGGALPQVFLAARSHSAALIDPLIPAAGARHAPREWRGQWMLERLNGEDGLGAIFPAMVNALEAMVLLGYRRRRPAARDRQARPAEAAGGRVRRAPTASPAFRRFGTRRLAAWRCRRAGCEHLARRRHARARLAAVASSCSTNPATGGSNVPRLRGGGWAFQFANSYYPDLDDTAVVAWSMHQARDAARYTRERAPRAGLAGRACRAATAALRPSTPTTRTTISTRFPSPIMARCSIRRPAT